MDLSMVNKNLERRSSGIGFDLYYDREDAAKESIQKYAQEGLAEISAFFSKPFKKRVDIYLFPNRSKLDAQWQRK
eukprot:UN10088